MPQRSANTQQETLQKLLSQIAEMKATPDADLPFLIGLETFVLKKLREPYERQQQAAFGGGQGQTIPGGNGMGVAPGPGGGARGMFGGGATALPPVDELRRTLEAPQGV